MAPPVALAETERHCSLPLFHSSFYSIIQCGRTLCLVVGQLAGWFTRHSLHSCLLITCLLLLSSSHSPSSQPSLAADNTHIVVNPITTGPKASRVWDPGIDTAGVIPVKVVKDSRARRAAAVAVVSVQYRPVTKTTINWWIAKLLAESKLSISARPKEQSYSHCQYQPSGGKGLEHSIIPCVVHCSYSWSYTRQGDLSVHKCFNRPFGNRNAVDS